MLQIIYYIIFGIVMLYSLYFLITGLFLYKRKSKKIGSYKPKHKIACLIAARNEGSVISQLVESLKNQDYPTHLYEIFVIPNNCTDNTKEIAEEVGASIVCCTEKVKSKGDVLRQTFDQLLPKNEFDAYIVFDADNLVHPSFITRMNDALCEGYKVAQGFRDSKNTSDSWMSGSYSLYYWGQNMFFNKSRMNLNASASINGTGFMIHKDILEKYKFNTYTMTEDIEFTAQCAINNVQIAFVEDAITYDEQPVDFKSSWVQRKRWTTGTYQCLSRYSLTLFKSFLKNKNMSAFDMSIFFFSPIIQILGFILAGLLIFINVTEVTTINYFISIIVFNFAFSALSYFLAVIVEIHVTLYQKKKIEKVISGILTFPFFLISWIPISILCLFKRTKVWEPIVHNRDVNIEHLLD